MVSALSGRSRAGKPTEIAATLLDTVARLLNERLLPKGVRRFKSFEEADRWALREMARTRGRRA